MEKMWTGNVRILKTETVKPTGAAAYSGPMYLTAWDQIFGVLYINVVHFYNKPIIESPWLETLKGSLGQALAQFSPLAGRLRWADETGHRLEIDCNGEGAEVVEAECDGEMRWFRDRSNSERVKGLVIASENTKPVDQAALLVVQFTRFGCGGIALGLSASHAVMDGLGLCHFYTELARLARGDLMKEDPFLDRTIFKAKESHITTGRQLIFSDHIEFQNPPLILGKQDSTEERMKETMKIALPLTKSQLDTLQKTAASFVSGDNDGLPRRFSRYEVVAAHIWRCVCKARGHKDEQSTALSIAIDARSRIRTDKIPQRYFGNTILLMRAITQVGELNSNPLGFTCGKLREAITKVDEDYIRSNINLLEKKEDLSFYGQDRRVSNTTIKGKPFHGNPNLRVISWLTLPLYEFDFGWGKVVDFIPVARDLDGSCLLLPGSENDGSILVVLCLQAAHVDEFKKHFYGNINNYFGSTQLLHKSSL